MRLGKGGVELTGIIAEEDTTEGGEGANQVRLKGDGCLDATHVGGARNNDTSSHYFFICLSLFSSVYK